MRRVLEDIIIWLGVLPCFIYAKQKQTPEKHYVGMQKFLTAST